MLKNRSSSKIDAAVGRSIDFEVTLADMARRSERRAWRVAAVAVAMSLVLAGTCLSMLPLKEKVPYLVMADAYTGTSTVARLQDDFGNAGIGASEAINRSNVAHFVLARESFDVAMMNLRDWNTVYTMSAPEVASGYTALHARNNPDAPFNTYGRNRAVRVRILSIVLLGGTGEAQRKGATVRFQRSVYDKSAGSERPLDSKIATLEFTYKSNLRMDEKQRIENPLGFQVTSYRVDNDYAVSPPVVETPAVDTPQFDASQVDATQERVAFPQATEGARSPAEAMRASDAMAGTTTGAAP
ncbi:MAG TPA: type IV secretion system protein [Luteimonas sp.]|nr:type IV secretion system protein [Luteimonas sp.]